MKLVNLTITAFAGLTSAGLPMKIWSQENYKGQMATINIDYGKSTIPPFKFMSFNMTQGTGSVEDFVVLCYTDSFNGESYSGAWWTTDTKPISGKSYYHLQFDEVYLNEKEVAEAYGASACGRSSDD